MNLSANSDESLIKLTERMNFGDSTRLAEKIANKSFQVMSEEVLY